MAARANKVALATTSGIAADAAAEIASLGGNAVDCGVAAAMCSINTQPGVCALAGGAFVTIWEAGKKPLTIDGNVAIPGQGLPAKTMPLVEKVALEYGGGVETLIGASSVAVPGTLAALYKAVDQFGRLSWRQVLQPSIRIVRTGFPLASACHYYLGFAGDVIYGRSDDGHGALHKNGHLLESGSTIIVPHLADSLSAIAEEGPRIFYSGEIGRKIAEHVQSHGGLLTMADLQNYAPKVRESLLLNVGDWQIATNPPPAIGGASLAAMLLAFGTEQFAAWCPESLRRLVRTQQSVMTYRRQNLDTATDVTEPVANLLRLASADDFLSPYASGSTVHTSAVDQSGLACSITASSGYGSGEMPPGTGLWLNNCLGELELNRRGLQAAPPGKRLPSNMAPSAGRNGDQVLAIGSPGADRITTALHQFIINFAQRGLDLNDAVAHPRLHLKIAETTADLAIEPGIEPPDMDFTVTRYPEISMYFGGVVAALTNAQNAAEVAADPRREGGTYIGPQAK